MYDILAGSGGTVIFPVPWARDPSISYLFTAEQLMDVLCETGFTALVWRDVTEAGRSWFSRVQERIAEKGVPAIGLELLLGPDFQQMMRNQLRNLKEDRIALLHAVMTRPASL